MRKMVSLLRKQLLAISALFILNCIYAQQGLKQSTYPAISTKPFGDSSRHWYGIKSDENILSPILNQPRYEEKEITKIADNILLFQRNNGGWPKNYDMQIILTSEQKKKLQKVKEIPHTTFDNSTTYTHIEYLAQVYTITRKRKYKTACIKGIEFCLAAQYSNGGWPQYYPLEKKYSRQITYNDGAFLGVLMLMRKIANGDADFAFVNSSIRKKARQAFEKGVDCVLNTQIIDNGRLTVWCQQHDEVTLRPTWARSFEPPSICNGESASLVLFLMDIEQPDERIKNAIQSAVKWFFDSRIFNIRVMTINAPVEISKYKTFNTDRIVITDSTAQPIWTRYYELGTDRPLFCDRNSKFLYTLAEVSRERRNGYGWYTYAPQSVLKKYPEWQKKWSPDKNVLNK